jgi:hypothetical protein
MYVCLYVSMYLLFMLMLAGPGQCYRLYSSDCLRSMEQETVPEILRTHMANAVLYLKILSVNDGDVLGFDFLDPPSEQQILEVHSVSSSFCHLWSTCNSQ